MEAAISCNNLVKSFGKGSSSQTVLNGINLDLSAGELTIIAGPSGSGKTTLLSILACTLRPTSGFAEVFGQNIAQLTNAQMARLRRHDVGFIFQQYNLIPALTAAENAAIPLIIAGAPYDKAVEAGRRVLGKFDLTEHSHKYPRQMSGGQQQRVAVARALIHKPRLVICDEPTAALDAKSGETVMQILSDIAASKNRLVIVVTHDHRIFHHADRLVEMNDGNIVSNPDQHNYARIA